MSKALSDAPFPPPPESKQKAVVKCDKKGWTLEKKRKEERSKNANKQTNKHKLTKWNNPKPLSKTCLSALIFLGESDVCLYNILGNILHSIACQGHLLIKYILTKKNIWNCNMLHDNYIVS